MGWLLLADLLAMVSRASEYLQGSATLARSNSIFTGLPAPRSRLPRYMLILILRYQLGSKIRSLPRLSGPPSSLCRIRIKPSPANASELLGATLSTCQRTNDPCGLRG
jgi:hypothetical protein